MALHGKICKNHKNRKNLKTSLFMFSPSRAGGSFLSHEGGEKASDGKTYSSRVTCRWKLRRLLRLQPSTSRGMESPQTLRQRNLTSKLAANYKSWKMSWVGGASRKRSRRTRLLTCRVFTLSWECLLTRAHSGVNLRKINILARTSFSPMRRK